MPLRRPEPLTRRERDTSWPGPPTPSQRTLPRATAARPRRNATTDFAVRVAELEEAQSHLKVAARYHAISQRRFYRIWNLSEVLHRMLAKLMRRP